MLENIDHDAKENLGRNEPLEKKTYRNISFDQFKVETISEDQWFGKYNRLNIKFHDAIGYFGPAGYDYFAFWKKESVENYGASKPYILIATPRSMDKMREDVKIRMAKILKDKHGVDLYKAMNDKHVIYAVDSENFSAVGRESISLFFAKK